MRRFATAAFAFAAGIFLSQYLIMPEYQLYAAAVAAALSLGAFLAKGNIRWYIFLAAISLAVAFCYNYGYVRLVQGPALAHVSGEEAVVMEMEVCEYPAATEFGAKVTVRLRDQAGVKAVYYGGEELLGVEPGNWISADVRVASSAHVNDTDITTFTSKGIFLLLYHQGDAIIGTGNAGGLRYLPQRVGKAIKDEVNKLYSGDTAGFMSAILIGDKSGLSQEAYTSLSEVGLLHITAVSGLHCTFLITLLSFLVGFGSHKRRAFLGIPILVFYACMVGLSPSVVRAVIMLAFLLIAPLFNRESDPYTSLSAALFLILLQNPFAAASVSLQLSFAAVLGMLFLTPRIYQGLMAGKKRGRLLHLLIGSFASTMGALVFTVPLTAVYFNIFSLITPITNLLCLWAATFAFSAGLVSVLLGFLFAPLGQLVAWAAGAAVWYIMQVSGVLAAIPYHAVYFNNDYLKYWLGYVYALFGLCFFLPGKRRRYALSGILAALTLVLTVAAYESHARSGRLQVTVLDVGQGASILLTSGEYAALVDCGSANSYINAGETAADHLAAAGHHTLDYLILTHYDTDHVNGVATLLSRMDVEQLILPHQPDEDGLQKELIHLAQSSGTEVVLPHGEGLALGEAALLVYPSLGKEEDNEAGLSVLCSAGDFDVLITGDMSMETERLLLDYAPFPDIELLLAGHHGSGNSTSEELLDAVKPEIAAISVGDNSHGHPSREALLRLQSAGCDIYRTDKHGNIEITVN